MKKLLFFVLVCGVMSSCKGDQKYDLPQDKIPLLKNNDIVFFQDSTSNKVDTFSLNITDKWEQTNDGGSFRYINIYYNPINKKETFLRIYTGPSTNISITIISIYNWIWSNDFKTNFMQNGVVYPYVYILHNNSSDTIPKSVYLTYTYGIIRYEYKDGRVYNLVTK